MHFSSSRLPVSTNYLTAIAFTFSATYQRPISGNRRVKELNLSEPFRAHRNNLHSYQNCIRGKYSSRSETAMFEIAFATTLYNFIRTFYRLRQTFSQVYCRKLAQCVGFEPTRRINARPDSNRLQYLYGNTAKFSTYRQRTFIVLFPRFLSRQRFHHKKNIIHYTKTRQPCHINNILQRVGIAGIEPATTRI